MHECFYHELPSYSQAPIRQKLPPTVMNFPTLWPDINYQIDFKLNVKCHWVVRKFHSPCRSLRSNLSL